MEIMNKTLKGIILAMAMAALAPAAFAQTEESDERTIFYVQPVVGFLSAVNWCDNDDSPVTCEDGEIAFGLSGGYQFNSYFSAEGGFITSSGYDYTYSGGISGTADFLSFQIGARGTYPIAKNFSVIGKAGFNRWNIDYSETNPSNGGGDNGIDPYFGLGADYSFANGWSITGEWTRYLTSPSNSIIDFDSDFFSASVIYQF